MSMKTWESVSPYRRYKKCCTHTLIHLPDRWVSVYVCMYVCVSCVCVCVCMYLGNYSLCVGSAIAPDRPGCVGVCVCMYQSIIQIFSITDFLTMTISRPSIILTRVQ